MIGSTSFETDGDADLLCCGSEMLFLFVGALGGLKWLHNRYLKGEEDNVTQSIMPDTESQQVRFPSTSRERLALGAFSGVIAVLLIFVILTVYLFFLDASSSDISGTEWAFWLVIIPGFFISAVVAVIPGALGGLLGARVATWLEARFQRTIDPRIGPITGGALGVLVPLLVFILIISILDSLGYV